MFSASNQYKKLGLLGAGGFGEAHLIEDVNHQRFVVKVCNLGRITSQAINNAEAEKLRAMAYQEADLMKSISHPYIVKVYTSFTEGSLFHIIMEFCDSGTLKQAIQQQINNGRVFFPEETICKWTAQLAMALQHLHNKKILHRDLKPANVFLQLGNGQKVIKLGDFGIAKQMTDDMSAAHTMIGTYSHMAPEMWQGERYTFKSEVWALGVILYELMALKLPFQLPPGAAFVYIMTIICTFPIEPLPQFYSPMLREMVTNKLLERDLAKRPEMAQVIADPSIFPTIEAMTNSPPSRREVPEENGPATENLPMRIARMPSPVAVASSVSLVETMKNECSRHYWSRWSKTPAEMFSFKAPSEIRAILLIPPTLLVICEKGEIHALDSNDFTKVEWRCQLLLPRNLRPTGNEQLNILHAAYDSETDEIYFSRSAPYLLRANRQELSPPSGRSSSKNTLLPFLSTCAVVYGISVDSPRRLLFACEFFVDTVSIWLLTKGKSPRLVAKITCVKDPYYIATFLDETDVRFAIARSGRSEVVLLQAKAADFLDETVNSAGNVDEEDADIAIDSIFDNRKTVIAKQNCDLSCGSTNNPRELAFDLQGNLFLADGNNSRFQIFVSSKETMRPVWTSQSCNGSAWRLAVIAKHPQTEKPAVLVAKGKSLELY